MHYTKKRKGPLQWYWTFGKSKVGEFGYVGGGGGSPGQAGGLVR